MKRYERLRRELVKKRASEKTAKESCCKKQENITFTYKPRKNENNFRTPNDIRQKSN